MSSRPPRAERLTELADILRERILVLDGAMGSMIQGFGLAEDDFRGTHFSDHSSDLKGDNELLSLTRPDVIREIHDDFFAAGADISAVKLAAIHYDVWHGPYDATKEQFSDFYNDAAAAPGIPPTARWLPNRGSRRASRRSCGRRRPKRRATPHR